MTGIPLAKGALTALQVYDSWSRWGAEAPYDLSAKIFLGYNPHGAGKITADSAWTSIMGFWVPMIVAHVVDRAIEKKAPGVAQSLRDATGGIVTA